MPLRYRARILEHLSHQNYRPVEPRELSRQLRVPPGDSPAFQSALDGLQEETLVEVGQDRRVRLPRYGDEATGRFKLHAKGFGFVSSDQHTREGDLHVPIGMTGGALSGDLVRVEVVRRGSWGTGGGSVATGRVVEILERAQTRFTGTLVHEENRWFVQPDGRVLRDRVQIRDPHAKEARAGDKVAFDLTRFPSDGRMAEGVIVEVLGAAGAPSVETEAVIVSHGLATAFSEEVLAESREAARRFEARADGPWPGREDLTLQTVFTIDPPDAKDFDDAISIAHDAATGQWTLGVHIADVAHFVEAGGALDTEARARGNSVYLPRRVLPMLPESLSNGVCSLQEGVTRLARSAFITFDARGRVLAQRLAATVIRSAKRMTYLEAQALLDGDEAAAKAHARTETPVTPAVLSALKDSAKLAKILRARRLSEGMIVLALPESELRFDDEGHVAGVEPEDTSFTHTLIEMFMVEANEALARTFADLSVPLLRRIHPEPSFGAIENLQMVARSLGHRLPDEPSRVDLQRLLDATRGTQAERAVHFSLLRTLSKATYSPALIGHYALASEHYAHFTSPIRRYPDLLVHRVMDAFLDARAEVGATGGRARGRLMHKLLDDPRVMGEDRLIEIGAHCSEREDAAEDAERELRTFLVLQHLSEKHLGEDLPGVVTGVMGSGTGVFITLDRYLVDGVMRLGDLGASRGGTRWSVHPQSGRLVAPRGGASIGIGDAVTVRIERIDLAGRQMEFSSAGMPPRRLVAAGAGGEGAEGRGDAGARKGGARGEPGKHHSNPRSKGAAHGNRQQERAQKKRGKGFKHGRRGSRGR